MSITIDTTECGSNSNSYATVSDADNFLSELYGYEEWQTILPEDKKRLLITATRMIDSLNIVASKRDSGQRLCFPITGDDNGLEAVFEACIMQAYYTYKHNGEINEAIGSSIQGVKREVMGRVSRQMSGYNPVSRYCPEAMRLLAPYINKITTIGRG